MPTSPVIEKTFSNPEMMMPIQCNQHPWMRMYLSVLPNPWFAVTGADGSFDDQGICRPGTTRWRRCTKSLANRRCGSHVGAKENE